jgi:cytochrome P450
MRTAEGPSIFPMPDFEGGGVIATADEPIHSVHRGILQSRFSSQSVATLEEIVRRWAREAVREWLDGGSGDFVPVAELVPARVVGDLLGLPEGDVTRFRTWAMIGGAFLAGNVDANQLATVATEAGRMVEYLGHHLDRASADLRSDENAPLLHLLAGAVKDGRISRDAAVGIAATMFSAGGESTAALIGSVAKHLAERPETARVLRETPDLVPRFVEEVGRLDPPFNFHYRVVRRSCTLAGFDLHPGDRLMLLWASANRDAARVDDPDELRLDRKHGKHHMTFGRGGHFCIGAPVARLEGRVVCEELLRATTSITPRPGHPPVHANSIMVRRLEHLPLEARPSTSAPT